MAAPFAASLASRLRRHSDVHRVPGPLQRVKLLLQKAAAETAGSTRLTGETIEAVPKRELRLRMQFSEPAVRVGFETDSWRNCQFFMSWACAAYPMFSRGKKLFQN
jgi:hypothetical protein